MYIGVNPDEINNTNYGYGPMSRAGTARAQWPMRNGVVDAVSPIPQRDPAILEDLLVGVLGRKGIYTQTSAPARNDSAAVQRSLDNMIAQQDASGKLVLSPTQATRVTQAIKSSGSAIVTVKKRDGTLGQVRIDANAIINSVDDRLRRSLATTPQSAAGASADASDYEARGYGWANR